MQREPKVLSAPECSFQAGSQARKQPVMAQGVPRTPSAQLCFVEAGVFLQPGPALCCSLDRGLGEWCCLWLCGLHCVSNVCVNDLGVKESGSVAEANASAEEKRKATLIPSCLDAGISC